MSLTLTTLEARFFKCSTYFDMSTSGQWLGKVAKREERGQSPKRACASEGPFGRQLWRTGGRELTRAVVCTGGQNGTGGMIGDVGESSIEPTVPMRLGILALVGLQREGRSEKGPADIAMHSEALIARALRSVSLAVGNLPIFVTRGPPSCVCNLERNGFGVQADDGRVIKTSPFPSSVGGADGGKVDTVGVALSRTWDPGDAKAAGEV